MPTYKAQAVLRLSLQEYWHSAKKLGGSVNKDNEFLPGVWRFLAEGQGLHKRAI